MKRCNTCKHWDRSDHVCWGAKDSEDMHERAVLNEFIHYVTVSDDTGLDTEIRTGPDFGCVLHEEKS